MKVVLFLLLGWLLAVPALAQPPYQLYSRPLKDSCLVALVNLEDGKEKLFLLQEMSINLNRNKSEQALVLAKQSQVLALKLNLPRSASESHRLMGLVHYHMGNFSEALVEFLKSKEIAESGHYLEQQAITYQTIAKLYRQIKRTEEVLPLLEKGLALAEQSGNDFIIGSLNSSLASYMGSQIGNEAQLPYYEEAIRRFTIGSNKRYLALTLTSIGRVYKRLKQYEKAETHIQLSRKIQAEINNPTGVAFAELNLGDIRLTQGKIQESKALYQSALEAFQIMGNYRGIAYSRLNQTRLFLKIEDPKAAIETAELGEKIVSKWALDQQSLYMFEHFSTVFGKANMFEQAYHYSQLHLQAQNKLLGEEIGKQLAKVERDEINQRKNQEISLAERGQRQAELATERERNKKDQYLLTSSVVMLFVLVMLYAYFRIRKVNVLLGEKNRIIQGDLEERGTLLRELHHRVKNNLQIVDSFFGLQERKVTQDDARDIIREGRNRLRSMSILHSELYKEGSPTNIQLNQYLTNLGNHLSKSFLAGRSNIQFTMDLDPMVKDADFAVNIGLIVNELLTNAIKYAFPNGREGSIGIQLKQWPTELVLTVKDDGIGLPKDSLQPHTSGLMLVRNFSRKIGGELSIKNQKGTEINLRIPESTIPSNARYESRT